MTKKSGKPAVMAQGASERNAEEGRGTSPADPPKAEDKPAPDEGFRDDRGKFTGNPATLEEKVDAIVKVLRANGMSLPMELE